MSKDFAYTYKNKTYSWENLVKKLYEEFQEESGIKLEKGKMQAFAAGLVSGMFYGAQLVMDDKGYSIKSLKELTEAL